MAKAQEIAGLECASEAASQAAEVLRARFAEILERRGAAVDAGDVEAIHDLRVATRRLRSALRDFAPLLRKGALKAVGRDLKSLADALGAARDEDVALAALEKLRKKAGDKAVKQGIGRLIKERRATRKRLRPDLTKLLGAAAIEDLSKRFDAALADAVQKKDRAEPLSFTDAGRAAVLKSLDDFCRLSTNLYAPYRVKKLHKLRISAKRLRYAIELFTACWGEDLKPFAAEIAEMQTFLGEVHDADNWIGSLSENLQEKDETLLTAHLRLLSQFVKLRTKNYRAALALWSKWQTAHFVESLREVIAGEPDKS
jgi:CHAD domain-containing protein